MTDTTEFSPPIATVDAVIFTIEDDALKVLLHRRPDDPFEGMWALPGGYIHTDEDADAEAAMRRVLKAKTGTTGIYLEQLATFTGPHRDPRGWSISIANLALVPRDDLVIGGGSDAMLVSVDDLPDLAFDHGDIIGTALARLRGKGAYSTLPASFLGKSFTLTEIQKAYETALGYELDQSSFRRKILSLGILADTGKTRQGANRRPARLYKLSDGISTFDRTLGQGIT